MDKLRPRRTCTDCGQSHWVGTQCSCRLAYADKESERMTPDQEMIQKIEAINATQAKRLDADCQHIDELTDAIEMLEDKLGHRDKHILALERIIQLQDDALKEQGAQLQFYQEGRH